MERRSSNTIMSPLNSSGKNSVSFKSFKFEKNLNFNFENNAYGMCA